MDSQLIGDLGLNSLNAMALSTTIQREFNLVIDQSVLSQCYTPDSLVVAVWNQMRLPKTQINQVSVFEDSRCYRDFKNCVAEFEEINPYFICHSGPLRSTSFVGSEEVINFGSYNYLGLSGHPRVS